MDWEQVLARIGDGESETTEFKRSLANSKAVARTLCAFANGAGGLLVLGVDDSGTITGVRENPKGVQERLAGILQTGCGRPVCAECGRQRTEAGWIHWVAVERYQRGYEPFSRDGRYWIRRSRSTVAPSPSELQELLNAFGLVITETQMIPGASLDHLDARAFRDFMLAQGIDPHTKPTLPRETDYLNWSLARERDGRLNPTLYGMMLFGRSPQMYPSTTSLFVQCARYDGPDQAADVLSVAECKGRLQDQVERAVGWFRSLGRRETYDGLRRHDHPLLPEIVFREAVVNAVIHRDYAIAGSQVLVEVFQDRIVVTSPGALPNHLTVAQATQGGTARSRNEMMANAMVVNRFMERRGRGLPLMRHHMKRFNGTEPKMTCDKTNRITRVPFDTRSPA